MSDGGHKGDYTYPDKEDDLDWMDPSLFFKSLSKNYENLFREGLKLYIQAWNEGDPVTVASSMGAGCVPSLIARNESNNYVFLAYKHYQVVPL